MDAREFDRLVARARHPRLIPGIFNYCDGRCPRCPFTDRCLPYLDSRTPDGSAGESVQRRMTVLVESARREGVDRGALAEDARAPAGDGGLEHRQDPLTVRAREYGHLAWRIGRAIAPLAATRGDARLVEAAETIGWFASMITAKLDRAVRGQAEGGEGAGEAQTDFNGSAKIALIGIGESRRAWEVLMEAGRATADGVPVRAIAMLEVLEATLHERFPRVREFVRPGFDEL